MIKKEIRKFKINEFLSLAKNVKMNPKAFWKFINESKKEGQYIDTLIDKNVDGDECYVANDCEKANLLAVSFAGVFIKNNFIIDNNLDINIKVNSKIEIIDLRLIKMLSIYKSGGPDMIPSRMFVECCN